eukprot:SAG31_NODE_32434_length_356_cov_0.599222_1_plen_35_part_10
MYWPSRLKDRALFVYFGNAIGEQDLFSNDHTASCI